MLPGHTLPSSWHALLQTLRPAFRRSSTFDLFTTLATGLIAQPLRRTVVGMLAGADAAGSVSFHSACRFFSQHTWHPDRLGLLLARHIVDTLLPADAPITVAVDDTLFRRYGRKIHHAFWTHDGAATGPIKVGRGNRWITAGIVIHLPFTTHPVCLPVLFRLWAGKGTTGPVDLAAELLTLLATEFGPERPIHTVGDAAYHGKSLLIPHTTITTGLPANAALHDLPPDRTGLPGRPALKGPRLGRPHHLATTATWQRTTVTRYGRTDTTEVADIPTIWYGAFGNTPGRTILVRDTQTTKHGYGLALFTTDLDTPTEHIIARYAARWSIECSFATSKQLLGAGQARNRLPKAVERTIPFTLCTHTLLITWYTTHGYHPDDITTRHNTQPWYPHKTEPAYEDMLIKLRRTIIASRISATNPTTPNPHILHNYALACAAAAA